MAKMPFVDRRVELGALDRFYRRDSAGLLVLFGRRRVGKTELLSHWLETRAIGDQQAIFWTANTYNSASQLQSLTQELVWRDPTFARAAGADFAFPDWAAAFNFIGDLAQKSPATLVVIIDEFTNILRNDPDMTSVLQPLWDHRLSRIPQLRLVLTGSMVSLIKRELLAANAPLYGRATALMHLRPLPYGTMREIYPTWPGDARLAAYAVCGGVPAYLGLLREGECFETGLTEHALTAGSIMMTDPQLILNEQLRDTNHYASVLGAIASGFHDWGTIAKMTGLEKTGLSSYIDTLESLELVEQRKPILAAQSDRKARYYVADNFMRFYYRFAVPHTTAIMRGRLGLMRESLHEQLRAFIGLYVFEEVCRDWVAQQADLGKLGFRPDAGQIGAYWQSTREARVALDVAVANASEQRLFLGECKWGEGEVSRRVLTDLIERSRRMPQLADPESGWRADYALFAREGFTVATRDAARELGVRLVMLDEIEDALAAEV